MKACKSDVKQDKKMMKQYAKKDEAKDKKLIKSMVKKKSLK